MALAVVAAGIASITTHGREGSSASCPGGEEVVAEVGGVTLCSHGPDLGTALPDAVPASEAGPHAIVCVGNGRSGPRVQAVYARPAGRADRFATLSTSLERAAGDVDHLIARSAAQTGGERHVRWATTTRATPTGCGLDIVRVSVPATAVGDFGALVNTLGAQDLDRPDRKYLVWMDSGASACSGIATHLSDDRHGQENFNNTSVGYGVVQMACLARGGAVETHELLHLLGAVQRSAPHVSRAGHCSDEYDLLCYDDDGTGSFRTVVSCPNHANDRRLDCHHDDYFSTDPRPGSYLDTHWNAANSRFLEAQVPIVTPGPTVDPPPNDMFAAAPVLSGYAGSTPGTLAGATLEEGEPGRSGGVERSVWYKWRPRVDRLVSVDTRGSGGDTVLDVYTGADVATLHRVGTNDDALDLAPQSRVTFTASAGTTYRIAVSGRGVPIDTVLRWGPPPTGCRDVPIGARFETAAGWAVVTGVMPCSGGQWRPRSGVTRSQGVAALWRFLGRPAPVAATPTTTSTSTTTASTSRSTSTTTSTTGPANPPTVLAESIPFTDVGAAATYRKALEWGVSAGVVPTVATFRPSDLLTRADLASWTWAALGRPAPSAAEWAAAHHLVANATPGTVTRSKLAIGLYALAGDRSAWGSFAGDPPAAVVF